MIRFPDLETLCLALGSGAVPAASARAPVRAGCDDAGRPCLQPAAPLPPEALDVIQQLGVEVTGAPAAILDRELCCWHELVPLTPCQERIAADAPVLFQVPNPRDWPVLASELQRLGKRSFAYRWDMEAPESPIWVRATGAPFISLLRSGWHAFAEQAPRVWVVAGYRHPLVEQIEPPAGKLLLIRPPHAWTLIDDGPFEEGIDDFSLDPSARFPREEESAQPCPVPLRLVRDSSEGAPELWVLREAALEQLGTLARSFDDALLSRLDVAVVEQGIERLVVLKARPSRQAAPLLGLFEGPFQSYQKLPNLFVPCGACLRPAPRRDVIRRLLADNPERIVWLTPRANGQFVRESVPLAAFRPLREQVDYLVGQVRQELRAWAPAGRFEFGGFAIGETARPFAELRKSFAGGTARKPGLLSRVAGWMREVLRSRNRTRPAPAVSRDRETAAAPPAAKEIDRVAEAVQVFLQAATSAPEAVPPAPEVPRHAALERRFLAQTGPPDDPQRQALWPELAAAYQGLNNDGDAALCWLNALWETEGNDLWAWGWYRAEEHAAHWHKLEVDLERVLDRPRPDPADVRALAGLIVLSSRQGEPAGAVRSNLDRIRGCLETNEHLLPARAAWLASFALARLAGGDVLSLARARDRLLERLFRKGLNVELDLPGFLRGTGQGEGQRSEAIRDWLDQLPELVHRWIDRLHARQRWMEPLHPRRQLEPDGDPAPMLVTERWLGKPPPYGRDTEPHFTRALADLSIAWGLARLGQGGPAARLVDRARETLGAGDPVHRFLFDAYVYRANEVLETDNAGPLPHLARLERLDPEDRYKVDWLRRQSRILEPGERVDPFRGEAQTECGDALSRNRALATLRSITDRAELTERIGRVIEDSEHGTADQPSLPRALAGALELAPRVGEAFALPLLRRLGPVLDGLTDVGEQTALLERGLLVAGHFGQADHVQALVTRFEQLLEQRQGADALTAFEMLAEQSFRGLRKLGMHDTIERLLRRMVERLLPGQSRANLRRPLGVHLAPSGWRTLLHVGAGWFAAGHEEPALHIVDEVRGVLFQGRLPPKEQTALACGYAAALGLAPLKPALQRLEELFNELDRVHFKHTTSTHYSLAILGVVEAVVRAVANDDFTLGNRVRRWLDEDEYLVRRRVHRDVRTLMAQSGIQ